MICGFALTNLSCQGNFSACNWLIAGSGTGLRQKRGKEEFLCQRRTAGLPTDLKGELCKMMPKASIRVLGPISYVLTSEVLQGLRSEDFQASWLSDLRS